MKPGQINPRSWDAAIRAVQEDIFELARIVPLTEEQDRILTVAFMRCGELTAKRHLAWVPTLQELARKYQVSVRTVTNWKREGCPFDKGQWRVLDWLARRRYAPKGAKAKFGRQLQRRAGQRIRGYVAAMRAEVLSLKACHRQHGIPMPDSLKGMPFRQR